jgi:hypothetical protein
MPSAGYSGVFSVVNASGGANDPDKVFAQIPLGHLPECRCGFYGFYDGSNDYYVGDDRHTNLVTGVVEGYGEVLIGTRGFRAAKAKIVALMMAPTLPAYDEVAKLYKDTPIFMEFDTMVREFPEDDGGARKEFYTS